MSEIIYCSNLEQLKQELSDNNYYDEGSNNFTHGNMLTPIKKNDSGASLAYVMDNKLDLELFPSLQSLGDYDEMFADDTKHDLYKSVYPYHIPVEYVDEDGKTQSYDLPNKIGVFA